MAFALSKKSASDASEKRSPLAGWLGRRDEPEELDPLPEVNVVAGLNRALRNTGNSESKQERLKREDPVRNALATIEAALYAIDKIRDNLEQACEIAISAKLNEDVGGRALLAERFDDIRLQINDIAENADPRAIQLIGKANRHLDVSLGGKARYSVSAMRLDTSERGLNLTPPRQAFEADEEIETTLEQLDNALMRADRAAANYCRDAQYLIARMKGDLAED